MIKKKEPKTITIKYHLVTKGRQHKRKKGTTKQSENSKYNENNNYFKCK